MTFGMKLYQTRKANNLTLDELAKKSGLVVSTISKLERDLIVPTEYTTSKLIEALGDFTANIEDKVVLSKCIICGKEYEKTSSNQKCCSIECKKENKRRLDKGRNKKQTKKQEEWKIHRICKTCEYRICLMGNGNQNETWDNTCCDYLNVTGEKRNCTPTDNYCEKYKRKSKKGVSRCVD